MASVLEEKNELLARIDEVRSKVESGEIVGMVGATVYHDGVCRFGLGGVAATDQTIAEHLVRRLGERVHDLCSRVR